MQLQTNHNAQRQVEVISLSALQETPGENIFDNVSERSITNRKACLQYGIIIFSEKGTYTTEKQFPNEVYLKWYYKLNTELHIIGGYMLYKYIFLEITWHSLCYFLSFFSKL